VAEVKPRALRALGGQTGVYEIAVSFRNGSIGHCGVVRLKDFLTDHNLLNECDEARYGYLWLGLVHPDGACLVQIGKALLDENGEVPW
jgi:hypothetical protein